MDVGAEDEGFVHISEIKEIWGVTTRENQRIFFRDVLAASCGVTVTFNKQEE